MAKVNSRAKWEEIRSIIPPSKLYLCQDGKLVPRKGKSIDLKNIPSSLRELQAKGWKITF